MGSSQARAVPLLGELPRAKCRLLSCEVMLPFLLCFFAHSQELTDMGQKAGSLAPRWDYGGFCVPQFSVGSGWSQTPADITHLLSPILCLILPVSFPTWRPSPSQSLSMRILVSGSASRELTQGSGIWGSCLGRTRMQASWVFSWTLGNVGEQDFGWWGILRGKGRENRMNAEKWEKGVKKKTPDWLKLWGVADQIPKNIDTPMLLFQCVLKLGGDIFWECCSKYSFLGSWIHLSCASWFVLTCEHQEDFPDLQSIQWGLAVTQRRFCIPLASSWHWLFFPHPIRVLAPLQSMAPVKRFALTAKEGSRISHFFCLEQSESYPLRRTCPGLREAWGSEASEWFRVWVLRSVSSYRVCDD